MPEKRLKMEELRIGVFIQIKSVFGDRFLPPVRVASLMFKEKVLVYSGLHFLVDINNVYGIPFTEDILTCFGFDLDTNPMKSEPWGSSQEILHGSNTFTLCRDDRGYNYILYDKKVFNYMHELQGYMIEKKKSLNIFFCPLPIKKSSPAVRKKYKIRKPKNKKKVSCEK